MSNAQQTRPLGNRARRITAALILLLLSACTGIRQISNSGFGAYEASLSQYSSGFAVSWHDTRDGNPEIYLRLLDFKGRPHSPERRLTENPESSYEADIVYAEGHFVVAWYERTMSGTLHARLGLFTPDGEALWTTALSEGGRGSRNPVVRVNGSELFCAWIEDNNPEDIAVLAGWWDLDGALLGPVQQVAPAGPTTWNLNATIEGGEAWVVFDAQAGTREDELFLARVSKTRSDVFLLTADDGFASKYPDLVFGEGRLALTWFDDRDGNKEVYLFVGSPEQLREDVESRAQRITNTPGESIGAYVAWNGRHFGLSWCDNSGGSYDVYFQSFHPNGTATRKPRRLTRTGTDSLIPAIRPWRDGFVLAWNEYEPAPGAHSGRSEVVSAFVR